MPEKPTPQCRAIVLCDVIYRDELSKKLILVGTFHTLYTLQLPAVHPLMSVYLALTEGQGAYALKLLIEHVESQQSMFETTGPLTFDNPNQVIEMNVPLNGLRFGAPGAYDVQAWLDHELVGQTKFFVSLVEREVHP